MPEARAHPVDRQVPAPVAALAEPLAVAVHGLRLGGVEPGRRALVLGAGAVGLAVTVAARALGAVVWQTARYAHQAEAARALGAARVLREEELDALALTSRAPGSAPDLVIETVGGRAETLRAACQVMGPGGTAVVLGLFTAPPALDPMALFLKEGRLVWSNCYGTRRGAEDFPEAIRILEAERERLALLPSHPFGLDDAARAFATAADRKAGVLKVTVVP